MRVLDRTVQRIIGQEQTVAMVVDRQCREATVRILSPHINVIVWVPIVDVYIFCNTDEQCSRVAVVGGDRRCGTDAPFEPFLNTTSLIVGSIDSVVCVDEDGLWFCTDGTITGKSDCRWIPRGIRTELRLIERETCNEM